jgi:hypothetical protein
MMEVKWTNNKKEWAFVVMEAKESSRECKTRTRTGLHPIYIVMHMLVAKQRLDEHLSAETDFL